MFSTQVQFKLELGGSTIEGATAAHSVFVKAVNKFQSSVEDSTSHYSYARSRSSIPSRAEVLTRQLESIRKAASNILSPFGASQVDRSTEGAGISVTLFQEGSLILRNASEQLQEELSGNPEIAGVVTKVDSVRDTLIKAQERALELKASAYRTDTFLDMMFGDS